MLYLPTLGTLYSYWSSTLSSIPFTRLNLHHCNPSQKELSMLIRAAVAGAAAASPRRLLLSTLLYHIPRSPTTTTTAIPLHLHRTSSSSSTRWKSRQSSDPYTRASKLAGLKSRAAYKLLEIHDRHRLFRSGATVVDLGYAPGSWSQVALSKVQPGGRVIGIDVIPAQPPRGVSTLQGDFLSEGIREEVRRFVRGEMPGGEVGDGDAGTVAETISMEKDRDRIEGRVVDVVLSDMSDPWPLDHNAWIKSVNRPFLRMMNTSGIAFKDHAGSMVCFAWLFPSIFPFFLSSIVSPSYLKSSYARIPG